MADGFPVATSNFENIARGPVGTSRDPVDRLPESAAAKRRALRQHAADMRALMPDSDALNVLRMDKAASEARLKRLRDPAQSGGFNIKDENHSAIVDEKSKLTAITSELARLNEISEVRSAKWREAGAIAQGVENFLRTGIPDGSSLVAVDDPPLAEILKKGERIVDGIDRLQRRCRAVIDCEGARGCADQCDGRRWRAVL
jgi:hypothetical protein